jgi:putative transposase
MADKSYPTDLKDEEWKLLELLLVRNRGRRGKRKHDLHRIVDGCFYVLRGGISWRMMPHDLPDWDDVYSHFRKWRRATIPDKFLVALPNNLTALPASP